MTLEPFLRRHVMRTRSLRMAGLTAIPLALLLSGCDATNPLEPAPGAVFEVRMTASRVFDPARVDIAVGDRVRWINVSPTLTHTTTSGTGRNDPAAGDLWDRTLAPVGVSGTPESYERRFDSVGTFAYFCRNHEDMGMKGTVVVSR